MAKPIFDTTKIKQNAPGLTYATPQSMPAKYNTLGGVAQVAKEGIDMAVAYKDDKVNTEAEDAANELTDEYFEGSETYENDLEQRKLRLESELETDAGNSEIISELNELDNKLALSKDQGQIGPGEQRYRMMSKAQELTSKYPAYQAEIAAKMNSVFAATGLNDILAADSALLKTRADAAIERQKDKIELVQEFVGSVDGMSQDEIDYNYNKVVNAKADSTRMDFYINSMKNADQGAKWEAYSEWKNTPGAFQRTQATIFGAVNSQLIQISNTPGIDIDTKMKVAREAITRARTSIIELSGTIPKDANEGNLFIENMLTEINAMEEDFQKEEDGTVALTQLTNKAKIITTRQQINLSHKINIPEFELNMKLIESLGKIRPTTALNKLDSLVTKLSNQAVISTAGVTAGSSLSEEYPGVTGGNQQVMQDAMLIGIEAKKYLEQEGELSSTHILMYNNALTLPQSRLSGEQLLQFQDTYLNKFVTNMPEEVLTGLVNNSNFSSALASHLDVYTLTAGQSLFGILGDNDIKLSRNKTDSSLFVTQQNNPELTPTQIQATNNALQRVTNIALIENRLAKAAGKPEALEKTITDLLAEHFTKVQIN
tara:strand:+ start:2790 stop:4592 length:1803 start_codon:yes stop_codon:yes gene_type:complete